MRPVLVTDNTLREGEQTPGVAFSDRAKATIFAALEDAGVARIDAGMPGIGPLECARIETLRAMRRGAELGVSIRVHQPEAALAVQLRADAAYVIVPVSDFHLRQRLHTTLPAFLAEAAALTAWLTGQGVKVYAALEDASRAPLENITTAATTLAAAGAITGYVCDTVGVLFPWQTQALFAQLLAASPPRWDWGFHGHDDLGMATANTLAAVHAGATHASCTVNGLGERCGNARMAALAVALARMDGVASPIRLPAMRPLAHLVEELSGVAIQPHEPVSGRHAFVHTSGVHAHGVLAQANNYESYPPALVGAAHEITIGRQTGRHAVAHALALAGEDPAAFDLDSLCAAIKEADPDPTGAHAVAFTRAHHERRVKTGAAALLRLAQAYRKPIKSVA